MNLLKGIFITSLCTTIIASGLYVQKTKSGASALTYKKYLRDSTAAIKEYRDTEGTNYNIYYGQLHAHSTFSDGEGTCEEAYKHVTTKVNNLDFFALTDHSQRFDNAKKGTLVDGSASTEWVTGHKLAKKYTSDKFVCMYAYEMTWGNGMGHMNTYNTAGFLSATKSGYNEVNTCLPNYYAAISKELNSVSQFNHPSERWGHFNSFGYYSVAADKAITTLEMPGYHKIDDFKEYCEFYTLALDKGWHVSPTNNQDTHNKKWGSANSKRSVILAKSLTEQNIYDAMKKNRTYSSEDADFYIKYKFAGAQMGSKINIKRLAETAKITLSLKDLTDASIGKLEVVVNGGKTIVKQDVKTKSAWLELHVPTYYSYYYIRIQQKDGDKIVTAPVWIGYYGNSVTTASSVGTKIIDETIPLEKAPKVSDKGKNSNNKEIIEDTSSDDESDGAYKDDELEEGVVVPEVDKTIINDSKYNENDSKKELGMLEIVILLSISITFVSAIALVITYKRKNC